MKCVCLNIMDKALNAEGEFMEEQNSYMIKRVKAVDKEKICLSI